MLPPPLLVLVVLAVLAGQSAPEPEFDFELPQVVPCVGQPRPVDEGTLVRVVARRGIELEREDFCEGGSSEPSAMFTNITNEDWDTAEADVIFASDGEVWCDLYEGKRFGRDVERRRVGEEVVLQVLNVECRIYESGRWQIDRLERAMEELARGSG